MGYKIVVIRFYEHSLVGSDIAQYAGIGVRTLVHPVIRLKKVKFQPLSSCYSFDLVDLNDKCCSNK
jgi:hypothetical protein